MQLEPLEVLSWHTVEAWLENFKHYFASVWDECNCVVVWKFFGIALLWDCNKSWHFVVLGHCWVFQISWHIECNIFTASSFRIWNSSTEIPSPPLALFTVMLPKAHLTSHSRMSGSRWVITPSWLSGSWISFLYSSSVYSCHLFLISSYVGIYHLMISMFRDAKLSCFSRYLLTSYFCILVPYNKKDSFFGC